VDPLKIVFFILLIPVLAFSQTFPLKKSANGRYLMDQNNVPFQIRGDGAWGLATGLDSADIRTFLLNRKAKGFNTLLFEVVNHYYTANAPNNADNVAPFTSVGDFSTPNSAYFQAIDNLFRLADSLHILVLPIPAYLGYTATEEGWDTEIASSGDAKMHTYGNFLGGRYKNYANVVWLMGGDRNPTEAEMVTIDTIRAGIRDSITTQWFTLDTDSPTSAADAMRGRTWLDINFTYCYGPDNGGEEYVWEKSVIDYARSPVQTFFLKETFAERIAVNAGTWTTTDLQQVRAGSYWSILSGSCGALYMNEQWAYFESDHWSGAMGSDGSLQASYCWSLFNKRNWWNLIPDTGQVVMTSGEGSTTVTYSTTAYTSDSTCILAYLPTNRAVTMNTNYIKTGNRVVASWLDPVTGDSTYIGRYNRTSSQVFTPTGSQDWVLVLDAEPIVFRSGILTRRP
jgi:hypothetical protein